MLLMSGCSKTENPKTIDELKNTNNKLVNEKTQLSKEIDNQNKLLDLRNLLYVKFNYLLFDMRHVSTEGTLRFPLILLLYFPGFFLQPAFLFFI